MIQRDGAIARRSVHSTSARRLLQGRSLQRSALEERARQPRGGSREDGCRNSVEAVAADEQGREQQRAEDQAGTRGHPGRGADRDRPRRRGVEDRHRERGDDDAQEDGGEHRAAPEARTKADRVAERLRDEYDEKHANRLLVHEVAYRRLTGEEDLLRVGVEQPGDLGEHTDREPAEQKQDEHPSRVADPRERTDPSRDPVHRRDDHAASTPTTIASSRSTKCVPEYSGRPPTTRPAWSIPPQSPMPMKRDVADRGRDKAGQEHRDQGSCRYRGRPRAAASPPPAARRTRGGYRRERARCRDDAVLLLLAGGTWERRPCRPPSRARSAAPRDRAPHRTRACRTPRARCRGRDRQRGRRGADAVDRLVTAVTRQEAPRDPHDRRRPPSEGAEDEVPGRGVASEVRRKVVPEPGLGLVDECEEGRGDERGRDADRGTDADQPQVLAAVDLRLLLLRCRHAPTLLTHAAPREHRPAVPISARW